MKKSLLFLFTILFLSFNTSYSQLYVENFDYDTGQLTAGGGGADVSGGNWINFSGNAFFIPVVEGSLSYPGFPASDVGNKVTITAATTSAEDARRDFPQQSGDGVKVYASFLVNLQTAPSNSSYFASLYSSASSGGGFRSRVFARPIGAGYELGYDGSGNAPTWTGQELAFNTTHLIVISYEFTAIADTARMWVDPEISATEPEPDILVVVGSDMPYCDAFALRQASTGGAAQNPDAEIDGIVVSNTWSEVVPVELTSFTATVSKSNVNLRWATASEVNNRGFEVQRKAANEDWKVVGFVEGNGTSSSAKVYSYLDKNLPVGKYAYRLKQVDFDGSHAYSNVVEADINSLPSKFEIAQNYPNPFNPSTSIKFSLPVDSKVVVKVFNILGKEVMQAVNENLIAGSHEYKLNLADFSSGIYFYNIEAFGIDGSMFSKTMKMTLMK